MKPSQIDVHRKAYQMALANLAPGHWSQPALNIQKPADLPDIVKALYSALHATVSLANAEGIRTE